MSRALIVTYHAVEAGPPPLCVHPDLFGAHVDTALSAGARLVNISELVAELASPTGDERLVAFTFDDGFASVARFAAPVLASHGLSATVFCVAGHISGRNDWATSPVGGFASDLLSEEQIGELVSDGFEIGSHGYSHVPMSNASGEALQREILESQQVLEQLTGTEVRTYAYPYGSLPQPGARTLVERTYAAACTTRIAFVGDASDRHLLPRVDAHYLRRPEILRRAVAGSLGSYLAVRRVGSRARRAFRSDYVTT